MKKEIIFLNRILYPLYNPIYRKGETLFFNMKINYYEVNNLSTGEKYDTNMIKDQKRNYSF